MRARWLGLLLCLLLLYIFLGGAIFQALESGGDHWMGEQWNYWNSVFFTATTLTTIGYGHILPVTAGGRLFYACYSLLGIPLTFTCLVLSGQKGCGLLLLLNRKRPFSSLGTSNPVQVLKFLLLMVSGSLIFLLVPASIFSSTHHWTLGNSLYFCFTTLTTVGFGDMVPVSAHGSPHLVLVILWILSGLCFISVVVWLVLSAVRSCTGQGEETGHLPLTEHT